MATMEPEAEGAAMNRDVKEIYLALLHPSRAHYEAVRARVVAAIGYDQFRDLQATAFYEIGRSAAGARGRLRMRLAP